MQLDKKKYNQETVNKIIMKKIISILIFFLLFVDNTSAYNFSNNSFWVVKLQLQYEKMYKLIDINFWKKIPKLNSQDKIIFNTKLEDIKKFFIYLDDSILSKNKEESVSNIKSLKNKIKELVIFLKMSKIQDSITNINNSIQNTSLNNYSSELIDWDVTYYADMFEGRNTANGNIFSQKYFSAAKCNIPLNTLIQVVYENKGLVVKVNDRPNCKKYPSIIDLATWAFDYLWKRYIWRLAWSYIELNSIAKDYYKWYFPVNIFEDNSITLQESIPNSYLLNESIHINWELGLPNREIILNITSPTGNIVSLQKQVDRFFSFSYPLEELGEYSINFTDSDESYKIYVLEDKLFTGKKLFSWDINKIENVEIIKDTLWNRNNAYRIILKWNNYNMATLSIWEKTYQYSWIWDIILPERLFLNINLDNSISVLIKSSKTITGFSHDFLTEPIVIFEGKVKIIE